MRTCPTLQAPDGNTQLSMLVDCSAGSPASSLNKRSNPGTPIVSTNLQPQCSSACAYAPTRIQHLLQLLPPLQTDGASRTGSCNSSSSGGGSSCNSSAGSRNSSSGGSRCSRDSGACGSNTAEQQARWAFQQLYKLVQEAKQNKVSAVELYKACSCVAVPPAAAEALAGLLNDESVVDPFTSLDTNGETAAHLISALTNHESSILNRDVFGQLRVSIATALAKHLALPNHSHADSKMHVAAAKSIRDLAGHGHSCNQTLLGRSEGVVEGLIGLLNELECCLEGHVAAAEALCSIMDDHIHNTVRVGRTKGVFTGLHSLLSMDPDHHTAPKGVEECHMAACLVLAILSGQAKLTGSIARHTGILDSLQRLGSAAGSAARVRQLAQDVLAQLVMQQLGDGPVCHNH